MREREREPQSNKSKTFPRAGANDLTCKSSESVL